MKETWRNKLPQITTNSCNGSNFFDFACSNIDKNPCKYIKILNQQDNNKQIKYPHLKEYNPLHIFLPLELMKK